MKRLHLFIVPMLCMQFAQVVHSQSAVPALVNYQGYVTDPAGTALPSGNYDMIFRVYGTAGALLYSESQTVTIANGDFSVLLGQGTAVGGELPKGNPVTKISSAFSGSSGGDRFLGITVDAVKNGINDDSEITPRQQIVTTAFAFRAVVAESVDALAVDTAQLAAGAVETTQLGSDAVTNAKLADNAVQGDNIFDGTITSADLANNAVERNKIKADAVDGSKIANGSIEDVDLKDGAVTSAKIKDGSIASADLANNAVDLAKLAAAVQEALCPVGTIMAYAGDTAPPGWLMCNGSGYGTGNYAALFAAIGTRFGNPPGGSFFNVPDLRGRFLRGRDFGAGRDVDRNGRTAMNIGGVTGDAVGSVQGDQFKSHNHRQSQSGGVGTHLGYLGINGQAYDGEGGQGVGFEVLSFRTGGNETRPVNANVNFIIKY